MQYRKGCLYIISVICYLLGGPDCIPKLPGADSQKGERGWLEWACDAAAAAQAWAFLWLAKPVRLKVRVAVTVRVTDLQGIDRCQLTAGLINGWVDGLALGSTTARSFPTD